jgi:hypothetical protein
MLGGNSVVFKYREVPDGLRRAAFVCFVASLAGRYRTACAVPFLCASWRCLKGQDVSIPWPVRSPDADQVGLRDCFLGVGTSVSRGLGKGYDSGSFPQRFRGRVRLEPALPDFRFENFFSPSEIPPRP